MLLDFVITYQHYCDGVFEFIVEKIPKYQLALANMIWQHLKYQHTLNIDIPERSFKRPNVMLSLRYKKEVFDG